MWIVPTPIGHLDDITLRAVATLRSADAILAEDTRHTRKLCVRHEIATPLSSLHAHSSDRVIARYLARLQQGQSLALVSDAGTPMISDPGAALVHAARASGIHVEALPGASAVTTSLCVSGIPFNAFHFVGFLPRSGTRRSHALETIADAPDVTVFFEAPGRLVPTLVDLMALAGPQRKVAVCRELTKAHEEVTSAALGEVIEHFQAGVLGEVTVVVSGAHAAPAVPSDADLDDLIRARLAAGDSARDIARTLSARFETSRRHLYRRVLELSKEPP